jgi:hypothetical protein
LTSPSADCVITDFTNTSADANDNKLSNASVLSDHDVRLMRDKVEMVEEKRREIARRYTQLQAEVASNLEDFMSHSMGMSSATAEFFRAGVENFGKRVSSQVDGKFPSAPSAPAEKKNGNSVLPSLGSATVFISGLQGQSGRESNLAMRPLDAPDANPISLTETATAILWRNAEASALHEVSRPWKQAVS